MLRTLLVLAALASASASAQPGSADASYGSDGVARGLPEAHPIRLADLAASPADEAVYVGWMGRTETEAFVGRVTAAGDADASFGEAGHLVIPVDGSSETLRSVAVGADGRIVATGQAGSPTRVLSVQLDALGQTETVAVLDLGEAARGEGVAVTEAQAFLAVSLLDSQACAVVGLDATGRLDPSFGTDGVVVIPAGAPCEAADLVRTDAGVVLVGTLSEGAGQVVVAQVTPSGTFDTTFGSGGVARRSFDSSRNKASSLSVAADGTLVVGGLSRKGSVAGPLLLRFDRSGSPLDSFGFEGLYWSATAPEDGIYAEPPGVAALPDGRVVFATTTAPTVRLTVGGVTAEGERDLEFGTGGFTTASETVSPYSYGRAIAVDSRGRVLVGGEAIVEGTLHRLVISRLESGAAATPAEAAPAETGSLRVSPNPTVGSTRIRVTLSGVAAVEATVIDSLGRQVATLHEGPARAGDLDLAWNASGAAPGLYVVRALVDGVPLTSTLTVAR